MNALFLDPGELDTRIALEVQIGTPDGQGGETSVWTLAGGLWSKVEPLSAKAGEVAGTEAASIRYRITIRARDDIVRGMRFSWQGRSLDIQTVHDPDGSGRYLVCQCEEAAP